MKLTTKQKLTIFSISSSMAHTQRAEITVETILDEPAPRLHYQNGPVDGHRYGTLAHRGKRKPFFLDIPLGALVFEGWDLPIVTDFEVARAGGSKSFSGNACYNLGISAKALVLAPNLATWLRLFILENNLNGPAPDDTLGRCVFIRAGSDVMADGELLWPEIDIAHAVVERMKETLATA